MKIYTTLQADLVILEKIQAQLSEMGLDFLCEHIETKINQKWLTTSENGSLLLDNEVSLIANGMKVSPNWQALQKRIVTAGKKSELLLQASKLTQDKTAIDATAGFGHDSLILASTGASVAMIEQNPSMFLLLQAEKQKMQTYPNWHKLLARLSLYLGNASEILPMLPKADMVYLDPMFPDSSYHAKVGKQMQILHELTKPPTLEQEVQLLTLAKQQLNPNGRVVVKRPKNAPNLGNELPQESWGNAVIRYDGYFM